MRHSQPAVELEAVVVVVALLESEQEEVVAVLVVVVLRLVLVVLDMVVLVVVLKHWAEDEGQAAANQHQAVYPWVKDSCEIDTART
jgi:hypothetical protein